MTSHAAHRRPLWQKTLFYGIALITLLGSSGFLPWLAFQPGTVLAHSGDTVAVPIGSTPIFNGHCQADEYKDSQQEIIAGFGISVFLKRDADFLYVCFPSMELGSTQQQVTVYLDQAHTGTTIPQKGDFAFSITRTGVFTGGQGDGNGGYTGPDPGGWNALVSENAVGDFSRWDAEFRISEATLGGFNHVAGLALEARATNPDALHLWPNQATGARPDSWADLLLSGLTWQPLSIGSCFPLSPLPEVYAGASPDLGGVAPTVLVRVGTKVHLWGVAESFQFNPFCSVGTQPLLFSWTLSFQPAGGLPADATVHLLGPETLTPSFIADQTGTYVAQLVAGGTVAIVRIEVLRSGRSWYSIGPNGSVGPNGNGYPAVGRLNALVFDPRNPATLYAGSALGGVWKSVDRGASWFPMSDHKGLPTLGVGALAVAQDGTVYAGTGDLHPNDDGYTQSGSGIWKSVDGGVTWQAAGTTVAQTCPSGSVAFTSQAARIQVNPRNPAMIYVAANNGLFRSSDGGNCWKQVVFSTNGIGVTDLAVDPTNPSVMYAAIPQVAKGLFKSTNADAPTPLFSPLVQLPVVTSYNWIQLAVAPSTPNIVYAALSLKDHTDVLYSSDQGATWQQGQSLCTSQCDYNTVLAVSPSNPSTVVYGEVEVWQSTNGTRNWTSLAAGHSDTHVLVFAPDDPGMLYAATDGGVYRIAIPTVSNPHPSQSWEPRNLDLDIAQAPTLALAATNAQAAAIGVWDNGTLQRISGRAWKQIQGGDGFVAAIDTASDQTIYYNINALYGGEFARYPDQSDLGSSVAFLTNPFRAGELFGIGPNGKPGQKLYVSENTNTVAKAAWQCADPAPGGASAYDLEFGPDGSYYLSLTDGSLYRFTLPASPTGIATCAPGATTAQNATLIYTSPSGDAPRIVLDPFDSKSLYAVIPGNSNAARVVRLSQTNGTWTATSLASNLPPLSLSGTIAVDPLAKGVLYLGTQHGLWEGTPQGDGSYNWTLNPDVPDTWIFSIVAQRSSSGYSGVLRLTTYGRGVWERHLSLPICVLFRSCIRHLPYLPCISCLNTPQDFLLAHRPGPNPADSRIAIAVLYTYVGEGGSHALLRMVPLTHGVEQPYFLTQEQQVGVGDGTAFLSLAYAARNAPLGIHTDALRFDLLKTDGTVITSTTMPFDKWWLRPEARLLTVTADDTLPVVTRGKAQIGDATLVSVPVLVTIQVSGGQMIQRNAPLSVPVPVGSKVTIQLPTQVTEQGDTQPFQQWTINALVVGKDASVTLRITDDTSLSAHYAENSGGPSPGPSVWQSVLLIILLIAGGILLLGVLIFFLLGRSRAVGS